MAILQDLPFELFNEIVVAMSINVHDLIISSSVCRKWRKIVLPHLFSTLKVKRKESFSDVVAFLKNHPAISECVKRLWLLSAGYTLGKALINFDTVHALLRSLPALQSLCFESISFVPVFLGRHALSFGPSDSSSARDGLWPATDAPLHKLELVLLNNCGSSLHPNALFTVLSLCETDTLRVTLSAVSQREQLNPAWLLRPLRVRALRLGMQARPGSERSSSPLYDALRLGLEAGYLRSLEVKCENWDTVRGIGALLHDVGYNINTLTLDIVWAVRQAADCPEERWDALRLSSCVALETFRFCVPFTFLMESSPSLTLSAACADIISLLPPTLRTFALALSGFVEVWYLHDSNAVDLPAIDQAIMNDNVRQHPELSAVVLEIPECQDTVQKCEAVLAERMPLTHKAHLLKVVLDRQGSLP